MPTLVNALSTRIQLQFFFPQSGLCSIFFHLGISGHVLGIVTGATGYVAYYETLCPLVPVTWEVMVAKHGKVKKNRTKVRLGGKDCNSTPVLTAVTIIGTYNVDGKQATRGITILF